MSDQNRGGGPAGLFEGLHDAIAIAISRFDRWAGGLDAAGASFGRDPTPAQHRKRPASLLALDATADVELDGHDRACQRFRMAF